MDSMVLTQPLVAEALVNSAEWFVYALALVMKNEAQNIVGRVPS